MNISGSNFIKTISCEFDIETVESVIFTFKGKSVVEKKYPENVTYNDGRFIVPFTQEDTILLTKSKATTIQCEAQVNFQSKAVLKEKLVPFFISSTIATEIIEGNTPSAVDLGNIEFEFKDDVVIAKVSGEVDPEDVKETVDEAIKEKLSGSVETRIDGYDSADYYTEEGTYIFTNNPFFASIGGKDGVLEVNVVGNKIIQRYYGFVGYSIGSTPQYAARSCVVNEDGSVLWNSWELVLGSRGMEDFIKMVVLGNPELMPRNGADGFSPVATVTKEDNKTTISITDKNGTTSAEVYDGKSEKDYPDMRTDRKLLWHDEFEYIDSSKWSMKLEEGNMGGGTNVGYKFVCDDSTISCNDSIISLKSVPDAENTRYLIPRMVSKRSFRNCLIEVKCKVVSHNKGFAGGLWLQTIQLPSNPLSNSVTHAPKHSLELDLFEPAGESATFIKHNVHYSTDTDVSYNSVTTTAVDSNWHIFGVEVGLDIFKFYRDGILVGTKTVDDFGLGYSPLKDLGLSAILDICRDNFPFDASKIEEIQYDWIRVYEGENNANPPEAMTAILLDKSAIYNPESWGTIPTISATDIGNDKHCVFLKFLPESASVLPEIESVTLVGVSPWHYKVMALSEIHIYANHVLTQPLLDIKTSIGNFQCVLAEVDKDNVNYKRYRENGINIQLPLPTAAESASLVTNQALMIELQTKMRAGSEYIVKLKDVSTAENYYLVVIDGILKAVPESNLTL